MKTLSLLALGALTLSACDFAGGSAELTSVPVASIQASGLTMPAGVADGTTIDRYVEIQNGVGQTIWRSAVSDDVDPASAIDMAVPEAVQVASATQDLLVAVYDYDSDFTTGSQLISRSMPFTATDLEASAELTRDAASGSGTYTIRSSAAQ